MRKLAAIVVASYIVGTACASQEQADALHNERSVHIVQTNRIDVPYPLYEYIALRPKLSTELAKEFSDSKYEIHDYTNDTFNMTSKADLEATLEILSKTDNMEDCSIRYYLNGSVRPMLFRINFELDLNISSTNAYPGAEYRVEIYTLPKKRWLTWLMKMFDGHIASSLEEITDSVNKIAYAMTNDSSNTLERLDAMFKEERIETNDYYFLKGLITY
ncbi:hypothetical protein H6503_04145 [Candidatus Woesearchaeota archaeon]|nr:hypothetical protein [Candidatus Woesearchaeota archaeon]